MLKYFTAVLTLLVFSEYTQAQTASNYFPSMPGYVWYFSNTPLDSNNNPMTQLRTFQVDSFSNVTNYQGLTASRVLSKAGLTSINQQAPYIDTPYYNFQGADARSYLKVETFLDTIAFIDPGLLQFLRSLNGWYNTYRFAQTVNTNYTIFSRDTTIVIDTLELPLRVSSTGRRLNDQTISTVNGNISAKKFIISFILSYGVTIPPFPTVYIPIVTRPDTVYIGENIWFARSVSPSINVDLNTFGIPIAFFIPGVQKELTSSQSGVVLTSTTIPEQFILRQNYPNPFNPSTLIEFELPERSDATLRVFNTSGKMILEEKFGELQSGGYSYRFDGRLHSSGTYFYSVTASGYSEVRTMILLK